MFKCSNADVEKCKQHMLDCVGGSRVCVCAMPNGQHMCVNTNNNNDNQRHHSTRITMYCSLCCFGWWRWRQTAVAEAATAHIPFDVRETRAHQKQRQSNGLVNHKYVCYWWHFSRKFRFISSEFNEAAHQKLCAAFVSCYICGQWALRQRALHPPPFCIDSVYECMGEAKRIGSAIWDWTHSY